MAFTTSNMGFRHWTIVLRAERTDLYPSYQAKPSAFDFARQHHIGARIGSNYPWNRAGFTKVPGPGMRRRGI